LDVRTQEEWDEYHVPNTTLIPLDQLPNRLSEVPKDKEIVVICRSGNRSQQGRDILLNAGYTATSVTGGVKEWYAKGYDIEGAPAQ
jgi:rhodanese-related sulfurtransferase